MMFMFIIIVAQAILIYMLFWIFVGQAGTGSTSPKLHMWSFSKCDQKLKLAKPSPYSGICGEEYHHEGFC